MKTFALNAPDGDPGPARRLLLTVLVISGTASAAQLLANALGSDGLSTTEIGLLAAFCLTFAWIGCAFWTALAGFVLSLFCRRSKPWATMLEQLPPGQRIRSRTALVMPLYHEDPVQVAMRLRATYRSLERTGELEHFDLFILSDSRRPEVVRAEEAAWARLCA
ncbi:MAG: glucans biosynthesis glucosyltransferase MdoH, partial [Geminicoccaceae bacterium]